MSRILLIDSYDSFTYNLAALCVSSIPNCRVYIVRNDEHSYADLRPYLSAFSAILIGPGPGSPTTDKDIGVVRHLWHMPSEELIPIFGICLGLQSLGVEHGASIERLRVVKHGQVSKISHSGSDIFSGVGDVNVTRYHSLHVKVYQGGDLVELAHVDDGEENGHVVMALKHKSKPFWGVQYHPESVKTEGGGRDVLVNFWKLACHWNNEQSRLALPWTTAHNRLFGTSWPSLRVHTPLNTPRELPKVTYRTIHSPNMDVIAICEMIGVADHTSPFVLLDSAAEPSRFTIIGSLHASSTRFTHYVGDEFVTIVADGVTTREKLNHHDVWSWAAAFMHSRRFTGGDSAIPFWGGLMGVLSYELGVHGLQVNIPAQSTSRAKHPDVNLVFVERSLVYDHVTENLCVQSLWPEDPWIEETISSVEKRICFSSKVPATQKCKPILPRVLTPDKDQYISRVRQCQDHLAAGESYELCLTARTQVVLPPGSRIKTSWDLYKSARKRNPAPHSAYIRLHPTTLVSTSPERFLSFSRPPNTICQLRPMKGTVRKSADVDRATAERLLVGSTKEVAENLMIVDLIRHDLHGVVGPDVRVLQFCGVEEYKTVWTMVSVIEGRISNDVQGSELEAEGELGWEVLRRSLPPGSMTGAPKKRSVEILQTLEDDERAIYSGVFGYWDVGGSGDWAVTIRSCFKHDEESPHPDLSKEQGDTWVIGAGGAITALSDPEAEWEEMMLKLQGVLRAFHDGDD